MPTRREAGELARALALSTQQVRDIDQIPSHSLSSERAVPTQDSRDLELKMVHPVTVNTPDEVALFSSRSAEGSGQALDIQSFSLSAKEHPLQAGQASSGNELAEPHQHNPAAAGSLAIAISRLSETERSPASSSKAPLFSPTQTSNQARVPITYGRADQRTPLRSRHPNQSFQLSSSPPELVESPKLPSRPAQTVPPTASSQPEIIEVIETTTPKSTSSTSSRLKKRPEIVLQSRSKVSSSRQRDSPDPLDLIPGTGRSTSDDSYQSSLGGEVGNKGLERKSSRVQAAAEKKEAEREEKRRLRHERKAKEAEALLNRSKQESSGKKTSGKKTNPSIAISTEPPVEAGPPLPDESTDLIVAIPTDIAVQSGSRKPVPPRKRARPSESEDLDNPASALHTPDTKKPKDTREKPVAGEEELPAVATVSAPDLEPLEVDPAAQKSASTAQELAGQSTRQTVTEMAKGNLDHLQRNVAGRSPVPRQSSGPMQANGKPARPDGIRWQTSRDDLSGVLSKFGGARPAGMSKRHRIAPLHAKIGPPAKALPPVPQKPVKKKKGDDSDDEDDEGETSEDEEGNKKVKSKKKGIEWFMMED